MRQLVSALELRFQALEVQNQSLFPSTEVGDGEGEFAPLVHTHVEADITDLQHVESIFELTDVTGTPSVSDTLVWNGTAFEAAPPGAISLSLNELTDVNTPAPLDEQVLQYDAGSGTWVAATLAGGGGVDTLFELTDTSLISQVAGDLLFNATGTIWQPTGTDLQWLPANQLRFGNSIGINWLDSATTSVEFLAMEGVAGQPVNFVTNESNIDTSAPTTAWVDAQLDQAQSAFGNGDEILVVAHALLYNETNSAANDNGFRLIADGVALTGSTQQAEGLGASVPRDAANPYGYMGWFTCNTAGTNIKTQVAKGSGGTNYVCTAENTLLLNLTKDVPNHVKATSVVQESIQSTLPTWVTLDTNITIGAGDWLVIASMKSIGGRSGTTTEGLALRIGGTYHRLATQTTKSISLVA
jgi:hypothetical protein